MTHTPSCFWRRPKGPLASDEDPLKTGVISINILQKNVNLYHVLLAAIQENLEVRAEQILKIRYEWSEGGKYVCFLNIKNENDFKTMLWYYQSIKGTMLLHAVLSK